MITIPSNKKISNIIPPNYSTWQTIELTYQCAEHTIKNNIEGVFVECGVASGNNLAAMCYAGRHGYGFDSFEGIPWAGVNDDQQPGMKRKDESKHGILESSGITVHDIDGVRLNFANWGLQNYTLIKGWFQDTVHEFDQPIAVLRLDGDLYDSTMVCLNHLYPLLSDGGILIMDDWNLAGCRKAFKDYFDGYGFQDQPQMILDNGVTYWKK
jgi:O-methyltransferase